MSFKSWHIALAGIIISSLTVFLEKDWGPEGGYLKLAAFMFFIFSSILVGVIPTYFLYREDTRNGAAKLSIIFGVISVLISVILYDNRKENIIYLYSFGQPIGYFLIAAGLYYFWKEKKVV